MKRRFQGAIEKIPRCHSSEVSALSARIDDVAMNGEPRFWRFRGGGVLFALSQRVFSPRATGLRTESIRHFTLDSRKSLTRDDTTEIAGPDERRRFDASSRVDERRAPIGALDLRVEEPTFAGERIGLAAEPRHVDGGDRTKLSRAVSAGR